MVSIVVMMEEYQAAWQKSHELTLAQLFGYHFSLAKVASTNQYLSGIEIILKTFDTLSAILPNHGGRGQTV